MKISKAFSSYIVHLDSAGCSKSYIAQVKQVQNLFMAEFENTDILALTESDIKKWLSKIKKGKKESTHYLRVCVVRQVFKYLKKQKARTLVDYENIELPPRGHGRRIPLTKEEVAALIEGAQDIRGKFVISFLYASGVRVSELADLNRYQINDRTFDIIGEKGRVHHYCHIDNRTEHLMEQYLSTRKDDWECLVASSNGRMSVDGIEKIVREAGEKAKELHPTSSLARKFLDKHITPHILRHSFATNFMENDGNVYDLKQELGHRSIQSTSVYIHLSPKHASMQYDKFHTY